MPTSPTQKTASPTDSSVITSDISPPGLLRRLGAMTYDALLLLAILMLLSYPYVWLTGGTKQGFIVHSIYQFYLLTICFVYYGSFWVHGGQTLGLRTWRLILVRNDGRAVTWVDALKRFAAAILSLLCFGLGYFWVLVNRGKLAWHDRLSETRLISVVKEL
ncbi:MAG: RDD family protein [Sulfuricaulis sp.]